MFIRIFHEYGAPRHFLPLYYMLKNGILIKEITEVIFDPVILIKRSIKNKCPRYFIENVYSLMTTINAKHTNIVNIVGMAPLHYFVYYFRIFLQKKIPLIYFTSWPYWDFCSNKWVHTYRIDLRREWFNFLRRVQAVVCVNRACHKAIKKYTDNVFWIPHSVDTNLFKPSRNKEKIYDKRYIIVLFVGRLVESKGIIELLEVAKMMKLNNVKRLKFWFVGDGPLKYILKHYEKHLPIKYIGYIGDKYQLATIYRKADILVLPSKKTKNWEELFGIVLIEAMSSGIPVIASNHVGPREIIENLYSGYLINSDPNKNRLSFVKELYDKILILAEDEKLRKQMGLRGRQITIMNYDVKVNMERWKKVLDYIMSRSSI